MPHQVAHHARHERDPSHACLGLGLVAQLASVVLAADGEDRTIVGLLDIGPLRAERFADADAGAAQEAE
jgi:hypothetical protein